MSLKRKVFLTRLLPDRAMEELKTLFDLSYNPKDHQLNRQDIIKGVRDKEGLISMLSDPIDKTVINSCPSLKIIANYAAGYNNIDLEAATAKKIIVTNTPGVLSESTADLVWALILAVGRRLIEGDRLVRSGRWKGWAPTQLLGNDIYGKTLGIVGMGRIGKAVAKRARGFSMQVLYYNRTRLDPVIERELDAHSVSFEYLLANSDFLTLHVPLNTQTRHLIGKQELLRMKPNSYLINTSRGPVVNEVTLIEVLQKGRLAGAGLDVFEHEPRIAAKLLRLKNVVVLPHIGTASVETRIRMGLIVAENLKAVFEGRVPPHQVNAFKT
ncbi:MAG: D-glycerate dehydrogenase [Nitrospira sp.]|nr:D-glycerate dehydrogenase [Nitrospira sp.]